MNLVEIIFTAIITTSIIVTAGFIFLHLQAEKELVDGDITKVEDEVESVAPIIKDSDAPEKVEIPTPLTKDV